MRRLLALAAIAAFVAGCNQNPAPDKTADAMTTAADSLKYPYKATYSSAFKMGDAAHAKTVLDIWKAYEENRLQDTKELWGDTVTMEFASGFKLHASRDSLIAGGVAERGKYTSVVDSVEAWMPLHITDKNEDWVAIWAMEYTTDAKGKKDTSDIHEVWQLKNGKAVYMLQFSAKRKM